MSGVLQVAAVAAAVVLILAAHPSQAEWKVLAPSTGVLATHAVHLPRSNNILVWGRQKVVSGMFRVSLAALVH